MGDRKERGKSLFKASDLLFEISDYLMVFELAAVSKLLGNLVNSPGYTLTEIEAQINGVLNEYIANFDEDASVTVKALYPVARHLWRPKNKQVKAFKAWLKFDDVSKKYSLREDIRTKDIKAEIAKMRVALTLILERLEKLNSVLE